VVLTSANLIALFTLLLICFPHSIGALIHSLVMRSLTFARRHCIHGLDADLIMLALATHEPNFFILREEVTFQKAGQTEEQKLHAAIEAAGAATDEPPAELVNHSKPFQFIKISVLRECVTALDLTCFHTPQTHVHMHDNARTHARTLMHTRTQIQLSCAQARLADSRQRYKHTRTHTHTCTRALAGAHTHSPHKHNRTLAHAQVS
jgi:hypothetical protein